MLHKGQLDVDHIDPLAQDGLDAQNNFALTHASYTGAVPWHGLAVNLAQLATLAKALKVRG